MRNRMTVGAAALALAAALLLGTSYESTDEVTPRAKNERPAKARKGRVPARLFQREPQSDAIAEMERDALRSINRIRAERGLKQLQSHETLTHLARGFSRRMAEEDFFDHKSPDGETLVDRVRQAGLEYRRIGENIFKSVNVQRPEEQAVAAWMKSAGHRQNILNEDYTYTGLGIWKVGKTYYFTQEFARLR